MSVQILLKVKCENICNIQFYYCQVFHLCLGIFLQPPSPSHNKLNLTPPIVCAICIRRSHVCAPFAQKQLITGAKTTKRYPYLEFIRFDDVNHISMLVFNIF